MFPWNGRDKSQTEVLPKKIRKMEVDTANRENTRNLKKRTGTLGVAGRRYGVKGRFLK